MARLRRLVCEDPVEVEELVEADLCVYEGHRFAELGLHLLPEVLDLLVSDGHGYIVPGAEGYRMTNKFVLMTLKDSLTYLASSSSAAFGFAATEAYTAVAYVMVNAYEQFGQTPTVELLEAPGALGFPGVPVTTPEGVPASAGAIGGIGATFDMVTMNRTACPYNRCRLSCGARLMLLISSSTARRNSSSLAAINSSLMLTRLPSCVVQRTP